MVNTGILDQNIFESMRLILPEHRALMKHTEHEQLKQIQPFLSEDQLEEMQYIVGEAIENGLQVRITMFGTYENKIIIGRPYVENGCVKVQTEDEIEIIALDKLIGVDMA